MGQTFLHGPGLCGSRSVCLNLVQSPFLGATAAESCQQAEKQDTAAGNDFTFLCYEASEPCLSNLAESPVVQICSEAKSEEQVLAQKPR